MQLWALVRYKYIKKKPSCILFHKNIKADYLSSVFYKPQNIQCNIPNSFLHFIFPTHAIFSQSWYNLLLIYVMSTHLPYFFLPRWLQFAVQTVIHKNIKAQILFNIRSEWLWVISHLCGPRKRLMTITKRKTSKNENVRMWKILCTQQCLS